MKFIWYLSSILTILLILLNNPKATSFGNVSNQGQLFSYTKSTQLNIQVITIVMVVIFLVLTIILASNLLT